jgi:hypothetical protein
MKNQLLCIMVLLIATALALSLVTGTYAYDNKLMFWKGRPVQKPANTYFLASGIFTGKIDGQISHAGGTFLITRDTAIYLVGEGLQEKGFCVADASVLLCGVENDGISKVKLVLVRPDDSVREGDRSEPRIPEKAVPSGVNSSTGVLTAETPR